MSAVSQRTDFGLAKKPQVFLWLFAALAFLLASFSEARVVDHSRQCALIFATDHRSAQWSLDRLLNDYLHLDFFPIEMKKDFIRRAMIESRQTSGRDENSIYLDIENSVLKFLNDLTNDKMLITSATNLHKKIFSDAIIELIQKNSRIASVAYSDFKSMRFKFQLSANASKEERGDFENQLKDLFIKVNAEYVTALEKLNLTILSGMADTWFRAGIGNTADEANVAARASRENKRQNVLMDFNDPALQKLILDWQKRAEDTRGSLLKIFGRSPIFSNDGFLTADVIDVVRKSTTNQELIIRLKKIYRVEILDPHASMLKRYLENIDRFAPGIYIAERKVASLEPAEMGGLSADFAGLGAKNLEATARALAGSKNISEILVRARENEQRVTAEFFLMLKEFDEIMAPYFTFRIPSGDDFVGYGKTVLHFQHKLKIMDRLARMKNPSGQRIAFIGSAVKGQEDGVSHRGLLAAHGESIEKELRKSLEGEIPREILKDIVFGLDMMGSRAGEGKVQLLVGLAPGVELSPKQLQIIKNRFHYSVLEFNAKKENSVANKHYEPSNVVW